MIDRCATVSVLYELMLRMSLRLILCCVVDKEESQRRQNKTEETAASGTYSAGDDMPYEVIPFCFVQLNSHPVVLFTVCQLTADSLTSLLYHFQLPKLVVSTLAAYSVKWKTHIQICSTVRRDFACKQ